MVRNPSCKTNQKQNIDVEAPPQETTKIHTNNTRIPQIRVSPSTIQEQELILRKRAQLLLVSMCIVLSVVSLIFMQERFLRNIEEKLSLVKSMGPVDVQASTASHPPVLLEDKVQAGPPQREIQYEIVRVDDISGVLNTIHHEKEASTDDESSPVKQDKDLESEKSNIIFKIYAYIYAFYISVTFLVLVQFVLIVRVMNF